MKLHSTDISSAEILYTENKIKNTFPYGVEFLDSALGGILESDLVLFGARSGAGKTELASMIAQKNAKEGKKVVFYALEAEENEVYYRMLFREVCRIYYKENRDYLRYADFYLGRNTLGLRKYIKEAQQVIRNDYSNLEIIYKTKEDISTDSLAYDITERHRETDIFVLDHLHYIDYEEEENKGMKLLMKKLREIALVYKKPIICVAHLRKRDRGNKDLVPDLDEFHGSSDITKIATKVITLAPYYDESVKESYRSPTLLRICKNRIDGTVTKYIIKMIFNGKNNSYEPDYQLGLLSQCSKEFEAIDDRNNLPLWAKESDNVEIGGSSVSIEYNKFRR